MNAQAILTPGGIADQLGGSLSGVAQALQRASEERRLREQQQFMNGHMLRQEARQGANDQYARDQDARQMTQQEFIQRRLEESSRAKGQLDQSRHDAEQEQQRGQELESQRRFNIGAGILSPAGQQQPTPVANALVGGGYGAAAALSEDDQAALRNREIFTARAQPRGMTLQDRQTLQDDGQLARAEEAALRRKANDEEDATRRADREYTANVEDWQKDRTAAMQTIRSDALMGNITTAERDQQIAEWNRMNPKPVRANGAAAAMGHPAPAAASSGLDAAGLDYASQPLKR